MAEFGISMLTERLMPEAASKIASKAIERSNENAAAADSKGVSFKDTLNGALSQVNDALMHADKVSTDFASGKTQSLHDVMIAMEKAEVSLRGLTAVRSKVVEAYQEIMRMPV